MNFEAMTDKAILEEAGLRIQRERLNQDMVQSDLARNAGLSRRTLQKLEAGQVCTLESLVRVLRALGRLNALDAFLPPAGINPLLLAKLRGRERKRASGRRDRVQAGQ